MAKKIEQATDGSYRYLDLFTDTTIINLINAAKALINHAPAVTSDRNLARLARTVAKLRDEERANDPAQIKIIKIVPTIKSAR